MDAVKANTGWADLVPVATEPFSEWIIEDSFTAALVARFKNPDLHQQLRQIAMDGTLKLPIRLVATWKDQRRQGLESPAIASWVGFARVETKAGRDLQDPKSAEVANFGNATPTPETLSIDLCALIGAPKELVTLSTVLDVIRDTWD